MKSLLEYKNAEIRITKLLSDWDQIDARVKRNRNLRKASLGKEAVERLRARKVLDPDETYIPVRTIAANVSREKPPYFQIILRQRRFLIFKTPLDIRPEPLENAFTRLMRHEGWDKPYRQHVDAFLSHGWAAMEVEFDPSKPSNVDVSYIATDDLVFPLDTIDIQNCELLARKLRITTSFLKMWVDKHGFSQTQVNQIITNNKDNTEQNEIMDTLEDIYKVFFRHTDGFIYVGWFSKKANGWLKDPEKLWLGMADVQTIDNLSTDELGNTVNQPSEKITKLYERSYPIYPFLYEENEESCIISHEGRIQKDENKQDATSALMSAMVNGTTRATRMVGSFKNRGDSYGAPKQSARITHGAIMNEPIDFQHLPAPDANAIRQTVEMLDQQNANETNQIAFMVKNRQDSRKTAREIQSADQEDSQISTVAVASYVGYWHKIMKAVWRIVLNRAQRDLVIIVPLQDEHGNIVGNRQDILQAPWETESAADHDIIQREEKLAKRRQDWPVISQTPVAMKFLEDYIEESYPDQAKEYIQALREGDQKKQIIETLVQLLQKTLTPEEIQTLPPERQQQLQQLGEQVAQVLQAP